MVNIDQNAREELHQESNAIPLEAPQKSSQKQHRFIPCKGKHTRSRHFHTVKDLLKEPFICLFGSQLPFTTIFPSPTPFAILLLPRKLRLVRLAL
ncbi:hypothetical protein KCU93_g477, partial [Aureobasidium melanogenum]